MTRLPTNPQANAASCAAAATKTKKTDDATSPIVSVDRATFRPPPVRSRDAWRSVAISESDLALAVEWAELVVLQMGEDPPAGPTLRRPAWQADAACREHGDLEWVPPLGGKPDRRCGPICQSCPVLEQCGDYAAACPDVVGVWSGRWFRFVAPSGAGRERWRRISTQLPRPKKRGAA